jgi:ArsR family transcriptional regulator
VKRALDPDVHMLQALADPVRLSIVRQLSSDGTVCACDFSACGDVSQPTVSHHLKVLREAGVVTAERRGTWIYYCLDASVADRLRELAASLNPGRELAPTALRGRAIPVVQAR